MGTIEEQVAAVIGQLAWINIKFSIQKSSGAEIVRIYGRKEARRGSFLGNEASPTRVAIIFALLYATSAFPSRIHLGPQSSVHYLVFPPLCLFLAFPFVRSGSSLVRPVVQHGKHTELRYLSFHHLHL